MLVGNPLLRSEDLGVSSRRKLASESPVRAWREDESASGENPLAFGMADDVTALPRFRAVGIDRATFQDEGSMRERERRRGRVQNEDPGGMTKRMVEQLFDTKSRRYLENLSKIETLTINTILEFTLFTINTSSW
jgi:hypothetical protein